MHSVGLWIDAEVVCGAVFPFSLVGEGVFKDGEHHAFLQGRVVEQVDGTFGIGEVDGVDESSRFVFFREG